MRGTAIANRFVQFETFVESGTTSFLLPLFLSFLSFFLSVSLSRFRSFLSFSPSPSLYLCCCVKTSIHYIIIGNCEEDACYVNPYKLNQNFIPELPPNPPLPEAPSPPPDGVRRRRKLLEEPFTHPRCEDLPYYGEHVYPN